MLIPLSFSRELHFHPGSLQALGVQVELKLLGVIVFVGAASARGGGDIPFFTRLLTLRCRVGCSSSTIGRSQDLRPPPGLPLPLPWEPPGFMASPLEFTLSGVLTPLLFRFLEFLGLTAFYMAFIFIMATFAAISAHYRAAEMVLVLHLRTIFGILRVFQLEHARISPITVGRVARTTLIVRRTTVQKIRGPFTLGGGVSVICFNCPPRPLPGLQWG